MLVRHCLILVVNHEALPCSFGLLGLSSAGGFATLMTLKPQILLLEALQ